MAIDVINNPNKHWLIVIIGKIKDFILIVWSFVIKCFYGIGRFIKRIWKILVSLAALIIIVAAATWGYNYYNHTYIPKKLLNDAIADIESKLNSKNDSIKLKYAFNILHTDYAWGYDNVNDEEIRDRLTSKIKEAFKLIEDKAYAGNARCQFALGQLYYHENDYVDNDNTKAVYWWNEAAQQGYTKAYNNVGIAYKEGIGVKVDLRLAVEWLKKGAEAGEDFAQRNYGDLYMEGVKVKVGTHKETYTTRDFQGNHYIRTYFSGYSMFYIYPKTVDDYEILIVKDIEQAKYWWKKSAVQGNKEAKERLQKIYN